VIELHDCFSTNELLSYEALGLCKEGSAADLVLGGAVTYGGSVVVNPSGGLISKGHPLGATGLAQCAELNWQLRGRRRPDRSRGLRWPSSTTTGWVGHVSSPCTPDPKRRDRQAAIRLEPIGSGSGFTGSVDGAGNEPLLGAGGGKEVTVNGRWLPGRWPRAATRCLSCGFPSPCDRRRSGGVSSCLRFRSGAWPLGPAVSEGEHRRQGHRRHRRGAGCR